MHLRLIHSSFLPIACIAAAMSGIVSCQAGPEGYWTSPNKSQALTNQQYPDDSRRCQALVSSDNSEKTQPYKARIFTQCMQATGYQWVVEPSGRPSLNVDARRSPLSLGDCSKGRLTIDPFGYQVCVPTGTKDGGIFEDTTRPIPPKVPSVDRAKAPVSPPIDQRNDGRAKDDEFCRQYSKESLSSTYGVYSQCMKDKGWSPNP
jgi:hypothetical protein